MKLFAQLLIWGSLSVGVLAAATAYLVSVDLPDQRLIGLTLADPAGEFMAQVEKDQKLTAEGLAQLRASGVETVRVTEFDFASWSGRWVFALSVIGLFGGAILVRVADRPSLAEGSTDSGRASPRHALQAISEQVAAVDQSVSETSQATDRLSLMVEEIERIQKAPIESFVEGRSESIALLGIGGYAEIMDAFAGGERRLNRAWSAAVDGYLREAVESLHASRRAFKEALRRWDERTALRG